MCFAPQRRALFRHLNFQRCSDAAVFCTFWLPNVLRVTTPCTFSTSQLLKVRRSCGVLYIWLANVLRATTVCNFSSFIWRAGSAPAALASLIFRPSRSNKTLGKQSVLRLSYLGAHLHLLSYDFLHLLSSPFWLSPRPSFFLALLLPGCAFHLSILSELYFLNFLRLIIFYLIELSPKLRLDFKNAFSLMECGYSNPTSRDENLRSPHLACQEPMQLGRPKNTLRIHEDHPSGLTRTRQKKGRSWTGDYCTSVYIYIYVYIYICLYIYMCIYIYVYIYIYVCVRGFSHYKHTS